MDFLWGLPWVSTQAPPHTQRQTCTHVHGYTSMHTSTHSYTGTRTHTHTIEACPPEAPPPGSLLPPLSAPAQPGSRFLSVLLFPRTSQWRGSPREMSLNVSELPAGSDWKGIKRKSYEVQRFLQRILGRKAADQACGGAVIL